MRLPLLALLLVGIAATESPAQITRFPYQAVIEANDVDVRSGPGRKYYPTNKLNQGDRVIVHRHDPGGQYMISPPAGSFSWIPVDAVKKLNDGLGVLTQPNVSVRIGSTLVEEHDIEQVRLSTGDRVEIVGAGQVATTNGPVQMYKIKPPAGEWRWISGQFVTPVDPMVRRQQDHDPFAVPSQAKKSLREQQEAAAKEQAAKKREATLAEQASDLSPGAAVVQTSANDADLDAERAALEDLDEHFRYMVDAEPDRWLLDELGGAYQELHDNAATPAFASLVRLRLQAIERYRKIQDKYVDFIQLTSETDEREAQYVAQLQQLGGDVEYADVHLLAPEAEMVETTVIESDEGESGPILSFEEQEIETWQTAPSASADQGPIIQQSHSHEEPHAHGGWTPTSRGTVQHAAADVPAELHAAEQLASFEVTGIVQRSRARQRGVPRHVLIAPDGQFIGFLQAPRGLNLDRFLGRPVALHGQNMQRPDLRANFIIVHDISPVHMVR